MALAVLGTWLLPTAPLVALPQHMAAAGVVVAPVVGLTVTWAMDMRGMEVMVAAAVPQTAQVQARMGTAETGGLVVAAVDHLVLITATRGAMVDMEAVAALPNQAQGAIVRALAAAQLS